MFVGTAMAEQANGNGAGRVRVLDACSVFTVETARDWCSFYCPRRIEIVQLRRPKYGDEDVGSHPKYHAKHESIVNPSAVYESCERIKRCRGGGVVGA